MATAPTRAAITPTSTETHRDGDITYFRIELPMPADLSEAAEREVEDGAEVLFELARRCTLDGPVTAVVRARCHFSQVRWPSRVTAIGSAISDVAAMDGTVVPIDCIGSGFQVDGLAVRPVARFADHRLQPQTVG